MAEKRNELGVFNLRQIVQWLGLPPRMQLVKEGLDASEELYRKLAARLASAHLGSVGLLLTQSGDDRYEVDLQPGAEWRDAAYYLGHQANLRAGRLVVNDPAEMLRRDVESGEPRAFADYRQAVLGHLSLLAVEPGGQEEQAPARAFRAAIEAALEVEKARHAA
ncbi:MAG: hypothetical protein HY910_14585 [Desulfarculus sp.]|nr:hypothetical protein [Desulfarculus sp.]